MLLGMMLISKIFFQLWVGDAVNVTIQLIIAYGLFTLINILSSFYSLFINGSGDLKLQTIISVVSSFLYLPIMIAFIKFSKTSLEGMVIFSTIWLGLTLPIKYYQVVKIVRLKTIKDEY
jgi:O-antigen/teichoic acid export membrane protein